MTFPDELRETSRGAIVFSKYLDEAGNLHASARDPSGKDLPVEQAEDIAPEGRAPEIGERLAEAMSELASSKKPRPFNVTVLLKEPPDQGDIPSETGSADMSSETVRLNGREIGREELRQINAGRARWLHERALARDERRAELLAELSRRHGLNLASATTKQLASEGPAVHLPLPSDQLEHLASTSADLVRSIDLGDDSGPTSLATAMADTWATGALSIGDDGDGIGVYKSEPDCAVDGYTSRYTRLGGSCSAACDHTKWTTSILRTVSPQAYIYCRGNTVTPTTADLADPGPGGNPAVRITSMSAWKGSQTSHLYRQEDAAWDDVVYYGNLLSIVAAGNEGLNAGNVTTPGKGLNLVTVGNYDDATDTIWKQSGYVNATDVKTEKPELSAPGQNIDAGGITAGGTSAAAPHVAGLAADLLGHYTWLQYRPHVAKAVLLVGAMDPISGGVDKVGWGGVDYFWAVSGIGTAWWEGNNASFDAFDLAEPLPDRGNGALDYYIYLAAGYTQARVAIAWLNRGTGWTSPHRTDTHPIGIDLDLEVYKPNHGALVGGSVSFDNSYEVLTFDPAVSGMYHVRIARMSNRDVGSGYYIGLAWNGM